MALRRTYGRARYENGGWWLENIEPHVCIALKSNFPRIPKTARPPYRIEGDAQTDADLAWFMERYPLDIALSDLDHLKARKSLFEERQDELAALLSDAWAPSGNAGFREGESPYPYQAQAAELARRTGHLLLMDGLGLGKTVTACAMFADPQYLPALVVANTHLVRQWVDKIHEFTTLTTHAIRSTAPYELPKADVYLCTYGRLTGWIDYAERAGFKSVVFEEVHELRNGVETAKGKACAAFRAHALVALGLSATPVFNYGSEIFEIVNILAPGALGLEEEFKREWCSPGPGGNSIVNDPQALGTFLHEKRIALRRTNADVGNQRPPVNTVMQEVPFDQNAMRADEDAVRDLARRVIEGEAKERFKAAQKFDMILRKITGVAKAHGVAAFAKIFLEAGQPIVLCGWHREVWDIWNRELAKYRPVNFTGKESPTRKDAAKRAFVEGDSDLFMLSLRSGAGIDGLQFRSHTIIIGEFDWSKSMHDQLIGRLDRPGQTEQVDAYFCFANDGSDPGMISVLGLKASQAQGIVDPLAAPADQFTDLTRIQKLAELYLAGRSHEVAPPPPETRGPVQQTFNIFEDA